MEDVRILFLLFLLSQICFHASATDYPKLTFVAIGDFGGIPLPPYTTYMQKKIAKVMGRVSVRESPTDFKTIPLTEL